MSATARAAWLAVALALPLLVLWRAGPGARGESGTTAAATLACLLLGLVTIDGVLRGLTTAGLAATTAALLLYGTFLYGYAAGPAAGFTPALRFLLASLALDLARRSRGRLAPWACAALLIGGSVLAALIGRPPGSLWHGERTELMDALFSSRQGLLYWTPLLWAGLLGMALLFRRDRPAAVTLGGGLALIFAAATWGPVGGGFFAGGRFDAALPLLAPGLALSLTALRNLAERQPGGVLAAGGAALSLWNLLFMEQYRRDQIPRDGTVSFARVTGASAAILSDLVGSPLAWPANWIFAERHGLPPSSYDLMAGKSLFRGAGAVQGVIDIGDDRVDPALLAGGWSARKPCGEGVCRGVQGRARILAPLESAGGRSLAVRAGGSGALAVAVNGRRLAELPLSQALVDFRIAVPAGVLRRGWNEIALGAERGEALVDQLVLPPPEKP